MQNIDFEKQYLRLKRYCEKNFKIKVIESYNVRNLAYVSKNKITICTKFPIEKRLYILLHEIGHFLLCADKNLNYLEKNTNFKTINGRTREIEIEVLAWVFAQALAKKLKIRINKNNLNSFKEKCLRGWCGWVLNKSKYIDM